MNNKVLTAILVFPLLSNELAASDELEIGITALAYGQNSLYVEGENQSEIVPLLDISWGDFFISQGNLGYTIINNDEFSVSAGVNQGFMADVDRGESPVLEDMKKLDETVNGFLEVKIKQYWGNISFAYLTDISNEHNGKQLTIGYDKDYISGNWFFTPSFNATLSDNRLVNYFYGVSKQEVHSTRPLYTADASWSISTTLMLGYAIDRNNTVFSFISGTWFDDQIRDSPITEKTTVIAAGLGYQYLF